MYTHDITKRFEKTDGGIIWKQKRREKEPRAINKLLVGKPFELVSTKIQKIITMTKRELKKEIDQLRADMVTEFVKRDKDIVQVRTEGILARNALADALANLEKRLENLEEFVGTQMKNTEELVTIQNEVISAVILACGLREGNKFVDAYEQIKRERAELKKLVEQGKQCYK